MMSRSVIRFFSRERKGGGERKKEGGRGEEKDNLNLFKFMRGNVTKRVNHRV